MASTLLLLGLLVVATVTDLRHHRVYNWLTYPGMLAALGANAVVSLARADETAFPSGTWDWVGISASALGLLSCGLLMLVCYVFFPGGVGGGDVKLAAMIGAFLGPYRGLEATLWMFVLGGCAAIAIIIWRQGALRLVRRGAVILYAAIRLRGMDPLEQDEREQLKTKVFLAPSSLAAVLLVQLQLATWL